MRAAVGLALAVLLACSHDARPTVQPDEHPPLPPASGTPIGYLIDDATELALRDDQLTQLKAIDVDLSDRLDALDSRTRGERPRASDPSATTGRHRGGRRGGMGGGSMGGGGMSGRGARGGRRSGAGSGSGSASSNVGKADAGSRASGDRATDVREALQRALALLDPHQQEIARRVLSDHGVDVDTDHPDATPGEPGTGSDAN